MRHVFTSLFLFSAAIPAFAAVDSGLLSLVPAGAKVIGEVDVSRARSSPFGQYVLAKIGTDDDGFRRMVEETGFDPRQDVEDALFVAMGRAGDGSDTQYAILVRGTFNQALIRKSLLSKGASVQPFSGVDVLVSPDGHVRHGFAFADVDIAVMGDVKSVHQILTNRANPTTLSGTLQRLVANVGATHDAWFAASGPAPFLSEGLEQHAGQRARPEALQSILESSGGLTFGDVVELSLDATTRSPQDATSLADVVRFAASVVQMQRQSDKKADILASSLDDMTLKTAGSTVHIGVSIPERSLEQLADGKGRAARGFRPTRPSAR